MNTNAQPETAVSEPADSAQSRNNRLIRQITRVCTLLDAEELTEVADFILLIAESE